MEGLGKRDVVLTHAGLLAGMERGLDEIDSLIQKLERGDSLPAAFKSWRQLSERMLALAKEAARMGYLPEGYHG
ncbi:MAG TPA: hypothetical protein VGX94_01955 [Terriglobia bacterium]|nr:hypothetical protein [Terriglobia bacterium]